MAPTGQRPEVLGYGTKDLMSCSFFNGLLAHLNGNYEYLNLITQSNDYNEGNVYDEKLLKQYISSRVLHDDKLNAHCYCDDGKFFSKLKHSHYNYCELYDYFHYHFIALYHSALLSKNVVILALLSYAVPDDDEPEFDLEERCAMIQTEIDNNNLYNPTDKELMRDIAACLLSVAGVSSSTVNKYLFKILLQSNPRYVTLLKQWSFLPLEYYSFHKFSDKPGYEEGDGKEVIKQDVGKNPPESVVHGHMNDDDQEPQDPDEATEYDHEATWNFVSSEHDYRLRRNIVQLGIQLGDEDLLMILQTYGFDDSKNAVQSLPKFDQDNAKIQLYQTAAFHDDVDFLQRMIGLLFDEKEFWEALGDVQPVFHSLCDAPKVASLAQKYCPMTIKPFDNGDGDEDDDDEEEKNSNQFTLEAILQQFSRSQPRSSLNSITFPNNLFTSPDGINQYIKAPLKLIKGMDGFDEAIKSTQIGSIFSSMLSSNRLASVLLYNLNVKFDSNHAALLFNKAQEELLLGENTLYTLLKMAQDKNYSHALPDKFTVNKIIGQVDIKKSEDVHRNPYHNSPSRPWSPLQLKPVGFFRLSVFGQTEEEFYTHEITLFHYLLLTDRWRSLLTLLSAIVDFNNMKDAGDKEFKERCGKMTCVNLSQRLNISKALPIRGMTPLMLLIVNPTKFQHGLNGNIPHVLMQWVIEAYISSLVNGNEDVYHPLE